MSAVLFQVWAKALEGGTGFYRVLDNSTVAEMGNRNWNGSGPPVACSRGGEGGGTRPATTVEGTVCYGDVKVTLSPLDIFGNFFQLSDWEKVEVETNVYPLAKEEVCLWLIPSPAVGDSL